jgi:DNA-binding transcriptional LysR family regulator
MQDLNDMMVFLAVVETSSFTLAAERLGLPKANVSRKVSRLEQHLGVTLLERSTRSQHLTEAGRRYLTHCKRIHEEVDLANAAVSEILHDYVGSIKIGASVTIGQQILRHALSKFLYQYPQLNLELSLVNKRVDLIEEGFDMLIRIGSLDDSRLIAKRLGCATRSLYASNQYLKQRGLPQKLRELTEHDVLLMSQMTTHNTLELVSGKKRQAIQVQPRFVVDDFLVLKQAVIDGLGVAILPDYMCNEDIRLKSLLRIFPEWGMQGVDIYALYPRHRVKIPKIKALLEFVVETFDRALNTQQPR